jgi:hypothetical protein
MKKRTMMMMRMDDCGSTILRMRRQWMKKRMGGGLHQPSAIDGSTVNGLGRVE